jgi:hypothetical protein
VLFGGVLVFVDDAAEAGLPRMSRRAIRSGSVIGGGTARGAAAWGIAWWSGAACREVERAQAVAQVLLVRDQVRSRSSCQPVPIHRSMIESLRGMRTASNAGWPLNGGQRDAEFRRSPGGEGAGLSRRSLQREGHGQDGGEN